MYLGRRSADSSVKMYQREISREGSFAESERSKNQVDRSHALMRLIATSSHSRSTILEGLAKLYTLHYMKEQDDTGKHCRAEFVH